MSTPTREQVRACFDIVVVVAEAVRQAGEIPAGHLYAMLMPHNIGTTTFDAIIVKLEQAKLVKRSNHLVTWVGPKIAP